MWFFSGLDVSVPVDFEVDGQFVTPTSINWTLRGADQLPVAGFTDVSVTPGGTSIIITISAAQNAVVGDYEQRWITIAFTYNGQTHHRTLVYGLLPWVPLTATLSHVRAVLGLSVDELPDSEQDWLFSAYTDLVDQYGTIFTDTASANPRVFNELVILKAASYVAPSLVMRARQSARAGDYEFARFTSPDFERLVASLSTRFNDLVNVASGVTTPTREIFTVHTPTDVITGG